MANREPEQPKRNAGYEFFRTVAWFSAALLVGSVALHSLGAELGHHHFGNH